MTSAKHKDTTMQVNPTIQASRERKITQVMQAAGCSRDRAIAALFGAKWYALEAIDNLKAAQ
jgi:NACalpha-BTF3-like transcription factor